MTLENLDPQLDPIVPGLLAVPDTKIYSWEHPRDLLPIHWEKAVKVRPNEAMIYSQTER